jgi:hypothetical protein
MVKISQSLMKAYVDYLNGKLCGVYFKANYIDKDPEAQSPPSDSMKAGIYFEYLCTGALPKSGEIPQAEVSYKGTNREKIAAPYERAIESSKMFHKIMEHYNIKILNKGLLLETKDCNGVVDIHADWDGEEVFIDLKYSGLIDDKWNEMGWDLESLHMKDSLMIQGVHYKMLANDCLGIHDIPFYYFVFSTQDPNNVKIIRQEVDESRRQSHIVAINNVLGKLSKDIEKGFTPYPSLVKCNSCPINHKCKYKVDFPLVEEVFY